MRIMQVLCLFAILFTYTSKASAGIRPSFNLEFSSWNATHIVVVEPIDKKTNIFLVVESWKGDLNPSEAILVPDLGPFTEKNISISTPPWLNNSDKAQNIMVTSSRMILFLKRLDNCINKSDRILPGSTDLPNTCWLDASPFKEIRTSVVWIEQGTAYVFLQPMNPGPTMLLPLAMTEKEVKEKTFQILATKYSIDLANEIPNRAEKARALQSFIKSDLYSARVQVIKEFENCGEAALLVLWEMLSDDSLLNRHADIIEVIVKINGKDTGSRLTTIVENELEFWKLKAPGLNSEWWNGGGLEWDEVEFLRDRYSKLYQTLQGLKDIKYLGCEKTVSELRTFWRSLPQLEDKRGLDQMSQICDEILGK